MESTSLQTNDQKADENVHRKNKWSRRREDFSALCVPLYKALINDDFEDAKIILEKRPELVKFSIIESYETALHVAMPCTSHQIVRYLVSLMSNDDLGLQNGDGETALYVASRDGNLEGVMILMERNKCLIDIPDSQGRMPLYAAALNRRHSIVNYLYHNFEKTSGDSWTHRNRSRVLEACLEVGLFAFFSNTSCNSKPPAPREPPAPRDRPPPLEPLPRESRDDLFGFMVDYTNVVVYEDIAIDMVTNHPELAMNWKLLKILTEYPSVFYVRKPSIKQRVINSVCSIFHTTVKFSDEESNALKLLRIILNEIMKLPKAEIDNIMRGPPDETKEDEKATTTSPKDAKQKYSSRVLFLAVEEDNAGFVAEVIQQCPHLALEVNDNNQSLLHVAASYGSEEVFALLRKNKHIMNSVVTLEDENGNNVLHEVAMRMPGSRLRLNHEYEWFRVIFLLML
ncbi:hypothetical protein OSB04_012228 [Centaurea solstitialis]|uniref:Uncharacterized protein n=1 Tax=Centaurea solstitialis TaxID=347529 RepID=A0AA38WPU1_9ASTR|nr:hypothetical protein OSB04_012228 [Centaurea solstitialis]